MAIELSFNEITSSNEYKIQITTNNIDVIKYDHIVNLTSPYAFSYPRDIIVFDKVFDGTEVWVDITTGVITLDLSDFSTIFKNNKKYYWKIKSFNDDLESEWSELRSFIAVDTLPGITISSPVDLSSSNSISPEIVWEDTNGVSGISYELDIATDAPYTNVIYNYITNEKSHTVNTTLEYDTTYYLRLREKGLYINGSWSEISFTTLTKEPNIPVIDYPERFEIIDI